MTAELSPEEQTYNPWTIVNVVFHHLVDQGFHPVLGATGHPGEPAAALLRAMGITPTVEGDARTSQNIRNQLADLRAKMLPGEPDQR
jgi:hypothetical protein